MPAASLAAVGKSDGLSGRRRRNYEQSASGETSVSQTVAAQCVKTKGLEGDSSNPYITPSIEKGGVEGKRFYLGVGGGFSSSLSFTICLMPSASMISTLSSPMVPSCT